jgi:hypothetical protein
MNRAEQVRQILATRNLTLYRVSQQSREIFAVSPRFHVPHSLYCDVADSALIPSLHQILALSHLTNYRLCDWLAVFGFDLDLILPLRLLVPGKRTTLLDSSVYDTYAWVPWFSERPSLVPAPPIAPLGQFLAAAAPRRARDLLILSKGKFRYGKVGEDDIHAPPSLAPGSIVRVDTERPEKQLSGSRTEVDDQFFFVEHVSGFSCSRLSMLAKDTILLDSPNRPCAQIELRLGKEARILGVIDAEIRSITDRRDMRASPRPMTIGKPRLPRLPHPPALQTDLRELLRSSRIRAGLSFREASSLSRWIADRLASETYFAAASTLSDYETLLESPRHLQKVLTLCILYSIDFWQFLRTSGLPIDKAGREPIPDQLVPRNFPGQNRGFSAISDEPILPEQNGFLSSLMKQWEEVPLFLRNSLNDVTGLKNFSVSDLFWVGGDREPIHPLLIHATFVAVNRRIKKPVESLSKTGCEPPLYLIYKRDGSYLCGRCSLHEGKLIVPSRPGNPFGTRQFGNGIDAEVVGQVTAIVRKLL